MNFKPHSEQELLDRRLMPKGIYDFEILEATEKDSKTSGRRMIELRIKVTGGAGVSRVITDYLLAETPDKLRHAADACDVLDKYDTGSLSNADFRNKRGKLKLGIEKDKARKYPDKNVVVDYVCAATVPDNSVRLRIDTR